MKTRHRITGSLLAIAFATTSALPAAGIPQIKAPPAVKAAPKVVLPPKVPATPKIPALKTPTVPKVPSVPKVPAVKLPSVPKIPVAPKVPAVKVTVTPKIPAVKVPAVKTPAVVSLPRTPKVPLTAKVPAPSKPVVVRSAVTTKPSPIKTSPKGGDTLASITSAPPSDTRATIQGGNGAQDESVTDKSKKKGRDYSDIENAYRRQKESEDADGGAGDPYVKNGGFDRGQFQRDERLIAAFENEQIGADRLLEDSKKPADPQAPATPEGDDDDDDKTPVAVTRGRIKDLAKVEGAGQVVGLKGDEPELVDAKDQIARGKVRDPKAVDRLVDGVANKGVDQQFGEAPAVDVAGLTRIGDALKKRGKFKEAREYYDQALDALQNGGKNSAKYRLGIIAEVTSGKRPAKDLDRVVKPGIGIAVGAGKGSGAKPGATPAPSPGSAPDSGTAPKDQGAGAASIAQNAADAIANRPKRGKGTAGSAPANAGNGAGSAAAGQAADTGAANTAQPGAGTGVTNQLGADTQNLGANSAQTPAATTPSSNNDVAGNNEASRTPNADASVTSPQDQVVLASPGNDTDFVHTQSADGNTSSDISYNADGTFTGTITTVTRDANGNVTSTTTQTVSGTYSEGTDGERHHTVTDASSPAPSNGNGGNQGQNGDGEGNGDDNGDDDKTDSGQDTPPADADAPDAPAENNDDPAEASTEGTPNPEARDRNGYTGRLADQSGGRLGGDEQRRQKGAIDQRKNGNGAGGPNPEANTSSGVLLTREEQSAFAKNLGMKRGGGVTTPTEESNTAAVTDRDLKDIAARRGSTINPASGSDGKGGSGVSFGKKGFTPGSPAPTPAPKGVQVNNAVQAAPAAASAVNGSAIRVDSAKIQTGIR